MAGFGCALLVAQLGLFSAGARTDPHFDVLNTQTGSYTNVTVTFQAKTYIMISHKRGMANVKVADLSPEALHALGYAAPAASTGKSSTPSPSPASIGATTSSPNARAGVAAAAGGSRWQKFLMTEEAKFRPLIQQWTDKIKAYLPNSIGGTALIGLVAGFAVWHLFSSYCFMLICRKARVPADALVWLPVFRWIPMIRAAGMSAWWFVAAFIPFLNVLCFLVWCVRIVRVCSKSPVITVFLIPPIINVPAFLYLAFSPGPAPERGRKFVSMALNTA